ncbi:BnaAnng16030D [Brassica napus]|uniref:BnaAnng16030D protein n=1 Tax=Brassica napus TaxID=3708 RepID=A0A078J5E0_BRANA|nr:BnaAnng16030D [Brassica napus]
MATPADSRAVSRSTTPRQRTNFRSRRSVRKWKTLKQKGFHLSQGSPRRIKGTEYSKTFY